MCPLCQTTLISASIDSTWRRHEPSRLFVRVRGSYWGCRCPEDLRNRCDECVAKPSMSLSVREPMVVISGSMGRTVRRKSSPLWRDHACLVSSVGGRAMCHLNSEEIGRWSDAKVSRRAASFDGLIEGRGGPQGRSRVERAPTCDQLWEVQVPLRRCWSSPCSSARACRVPLFSVVGWAGQSAPFRV